MCVCVCFYIYRCCERFSAFGRSSPTANGPPNPSVYVCVCVCVCVYLHIYVCVCVYIYVSYTYVCINVESGRAADLNFGCRYLFNTLFIDDYLSWLQVTFFSFITLKPRVE